jgi:hypothetical protein
MAPLTDRAWQISIDRVRETCCTIGQFDNGNAIWGLNRRRWDTRERLRIVIVTWIERT